MIASRVGVDSGCVSKFSDPHHQRFFQQASLLQVFQQCRKCLIHHGHQKGFQAFAVITVSIPGPVVGAALDASPVDLDQ
jgi:hypothetical protein